MPEQYFQKDPHKCDACVNKGLRGGRNRKIFGGAIEEEELLLERQPSSLAAFRQVEISLQDFLEERLKKDGGQKWYLEFTVTFGKPIGDITLTSDFSHMPLILLDPTDIQESISESFQLLNEKIDDFQELGSGWRLLEVNKVKVMAVSYDPLGS
jgi:hypothetical protein